MMEVFSVLESEQEDFVDSIVSWFYIIAKNKTSANEIFKTYTKDYLIGKYNVLKLGELKRVQNDKFKIIKLPGITSSSKIEGVKADLSQRSYIWKKS